MRCLLILSLVFWFAGCDGKVDSSNHTSTATTVSVDHYGSLFSHNEKGEILEFTACGDDEKAECEIFKNEFQTVSVQDIVVIDSIRKDNTTCCQTIIIGGRMKQRCREFMTSISVCPDGWWNLN